MKELQKNKNKLESYWTFNCYDDSKTEYFSQIEMYYSSLISLKDVKKNINNPSQTLKHVLIVEVKDKSDKQKIEYLLGKLNSIENVSYNPLILFLYDEYDFSNNNTLDINFEKYNYIDPRTIFIGPFISKN